jgi:hypothetical protein
MNVSEMRETLNRHWAAASDANDFVVEHDIYREDALLEYPQSGERIRGRHNIQGLSHRTAEQQALHGAPHRRHGRPLGLGIHHHQRRPAVLLGERHGVPGWQGRSRDPVRIIAARRAQFRRRRGVRSRNALAKQKDRATTHRYMRIADIAVGEPTPMARSDPNRGDLN